MAEVKFMQLSQDRVTVKRSGEFKSQLGASGRLLSEKLSDYHWDNTGNQYEHDGVGYLFNYDLEAMELAVNSPSVAVPRGLSKAELITWLNGDWSETGKL